LSSFRESDRQPHLLEFGKRGKYTRLRIGAGRSSYQPPCALRMFDMMRLTGFDSFNDGRDRLGDTGLLAFLLTSAHCSETFVHSEIEDTLTNYFSTERPKFPKGGQTLTCTHCGKESLFQRTDLIYQGESVRRKAASS
jgi:hypothetical protein